MPIYDAPNLTGGMDDAIVDVAQTVPSFVPSLLFFVFFVILLGGAINQKRRMGSSDIPMWATVSSIATLMVTLILTLAEGLVQPIVLPVVVVVTILSGVWLFLDRNRNEI